MLKNEWLLDHVSECEHCGVERTVMYPGINCFTCGLVIPSYAAEYVVLTCHNFKSLSYVICAMCEATIRIKRKYRNGSIDDYKHEFDKFIERIRHATKRQASRHH